MSTEKSINPVGSEPAVSQYLHNKGRETGTPVSGTFELTGRCNFNCKMCYVHGDNCEEMKNELPADWWIDLGRQAIEAGTVFLLLTGGEPILHKDFTRIYRELSQMGFVISINSNGYLLKGEILELFREYPPNRINISLYGTSDDTYEKFTGVRAFSTIMENVKTLREMNIQVRFNCSITPDNVHDLEKIYKIGQELGLYIKATPYMYPQVRVNGQQFGENDNRLTAEEAARCRVGWSRLRYDTDEFMQRARNMKQEIEKLSMPCEIKNPATGVLCRAGSTSFWVNKNGSLSLCGMIDKSFSLKDSSFSEQWERVREFTASITLPAKCANCEYRNICNVCAAVCYAETGSFSGVPEYVCRFSAETARLTLNELERFEENGN